MDIEKIAQALFDQLHDHSAKIATALFFMALGWVFGRRRARADWKKREFYDLINLSLNTIENGQLLIRTLSEKRCSEIFLNAAAADTVMKTARLTTEKDPLLPLPAHDYWYYLNAVLNELSEQFAVGHLRRDLGQPVARDRYVICLTREVAGEVRAQKIRAMVVRKAVLEQLGSAELKIESSTHSTRVTTLHFMAQELVRNPGRFLEVELAV